MTSGADRSDDMRYWLELEGLTYVFETLADYGRRLSEAGFDDVKTTDASDWYQAEVRREYELIRDDLYDSMIELLGKSDADHFVESWRVMAVVCGSGEMRQGYCRGRRP